MSDRKYRQRGYQDSDRDRGERQRPQPAAPPSDRLRPDRPKGRGLGAPDRQVFRCAVCGAEQAVPQADDAACSECASDLHTCTHCRSFDSAARWQCRQDIPAPVTKKGQRNECPLFVPRVAVEHGADRVEPGDARAAFDALFKI